MNSLEKAQAIRSIVGLEARKKHYFVQQELNTIAEYLELSKEGLIQLKWWTDRGRFRMGCVGADDMAILLGLVTKQKVLKDAQESIKPTRLVPPSESQEFHGQEEFSVVDVGLTDEETNIVSIFNMLPKAMTEEATFLCIEKEPEQHRRAINGRLRTLSTNKWTVKVSFERK